jgi:hypothetical protein
MITVIIVVTLIVLLFLRLPFLNLLLLSFLVLAFAFLLVSFLSVSFLLVSFLLLSRDGLWYNEWIILPWGSKCSCLPRRILALLADECRLFGPAKIDFNSGRELEDKGVMVTQDCSSRVGARRFYKGSQGLADLETD